LIGQGGERSESPNRQREGAIKRRAPLEKKNLGAKISGGRGAHWGEKKQSFHIVLVEERGLEKKSGKLTNHKGGTKIGKIQQFGMCGRRYFKRLRGEKRF